MIRYRSFQNSDPPKLVSLWHACQLGRGAVDALTADAFETLSFAQPYFDPAGLEVAQDGTRIVGFVHAGFGVNEDESGLSQESGVICIVMVHPDYRRRGVGRELVSRAESYLKAAGATTLFLGSAAPRDPFYVGMYGGSQPAGFLESDPDAAPFCEALGYEPVERHIVFGRGTSESNVPISMRLVTIRRKMQLTIADEPQRASWWWSTRFGRLDSIRFLLVPKDGGPSVAGVTVLGLDLYMTKWRQRTIGLIDLFVPEDRRGQGYAQALVIEVCRRLRDELVTGVEAHALETDTRAVGVLASAGFQRVDTGIVYRRLGETP